MNYLIDFATTLSDADINAYLAANNMTSVKAYTTFKNVHLVSSEVEPKVDSSVLKVNSDDGNDIKLLDFDITVTQPKSEELDIQVHDDKDWWKVVSLNDVDLSKPTYTQERRGFGSVVYIMDSGIEATHPDFTNAKVTLLHSFTTDFTDTKGHGTALASLVAGDTCGLTRAEIKVVKVFDINTATKQSDLLSALDAIAVDYNSNGLPPSVLNLSWSIARNIYVDSKIQELIDLGIFVVAAAGNSGTAIGDVTPAAIPDVLTIGSFGQSLTPSDFSDYTGSAISVTVSTTNSGALDGWAPGEKIWAAVLKGTYAFIAGTSASSAIASGAIAHNLSVYVDSNGNTPSVYTNHSARKDYFAGVLSTSNITMDDNTMYRMMCLGRKDVLNLSDPKYALSENLIASYLQSVAIVSPTIRIISESGKPYYSDVLVNAPITRITGPDLPSYVTIDETGLMTITSPTITDPYEQLPSLSLTTYSASGATQNISVMLFVFRDGVTLGNISTLVPTTDPVVNAVLLANTCLTNGYCGVDDCYLEGPFACVGGGKFGCYCQYGSDERVKDNILLEDTIDGLNIYSYNYIWDKHRRLSGVMAQELIGTVHEKAVVNTESGYFKVDYNRLPSNVKFRIFGK